MKIHTLEVFEDKWRIVHVSSLPVQRPMYIWECYPKATNWRRVIYTVDDEILWKNMTNYKVTDQGNINEYYEEIFGH